jgi:hypothetical protein
MKPLISCPAATDRSYQLLALLDVCEHSARFIGETGQQHVARAAGSLTNVLELASEIASEIHDALERRERKEVASVMSITDKVPETR